ncbi:hypothetical protein D3877_19710 [Azospirillum cavernae]|uniref:Uncharacterized protein n=1 Tax=Azospirillum cavernae TaxID=2320860 RepID=A0A418VYL5_9PROT|nr:hypothetical protein [Azospirillum cavernae]RJF82273.1 hypothetical protein D3877_19710 [Azospirillum cavernae]
MSTLLALPSPSSAQSPSGLAKLRQMLASDAPAVQPIRRVPGEDERKRSSSDQPLEATDEALRRSGQTGTDETRAASRSTGGASSGFAIGGGASAANGPVSPGPTPQTALPNAGFITQSLHQEVVGQGLHIEPWTDAIDAYRRADAGVNTPLVTQIAV